MAFWSELRGGSRARLIGALVDAYRDELRLAAQLRAHASSVPYPADGAHLARLAERSQARAAAVADELTRHRAAVQNGDARPPRGGRNYWQRLTADLEDLRALGKQYRELSLHWDVDYPETAALFDRLSHDTAVMVTTVTALIARSDPHAAD
jgi:hypothetical protein